MGEVKRLWPLDARVGLREIEYQRGDAKASRQRSAMEPAIPHGHDELAVADGERAGEVHGVSAAQSVLDGELAGMTLDCGRQLHRPGCPPELRPAFFGLLETVLVEVMVPVGGSERRPDLRICQPARHGGVASVPKRGSQTRSRLFHEQFHERTCIEVDDRQLSAVAR